MTTESYDMHAIRNALAIAHGHLWLALESVGQVPSPHEIPGLDKRLRAALEALDRLKVLVATPKTG